jgi:hypothetical protein
MERPAEDDDLSADMLALLAATVPEVGPRNKEEDDALDAQTLQRLYDASMRASQELFRSVEHTPVLSDLMGPDAGDVDPRQTQEITEDDFEPEDWPIYRALRAHMRALVSLNTPHPQRASEMRWLMCPMPDRQGLRFDDACHALMSRPYVVRTRALYQLWRNGIDVAFELPGLYFPLPKGLVYEIDGHPEMFDVAGRVAMAKLIWQHPGILVEDAMEQALARSIPAAPAALAALIDYGYVGQTTQRRLYFITRNPSQLGFRARANFSWALSLPQID